MNNAIFGGTIENLRNRINLELVNSENDYLKCTSKPSYMLHKTFHNNLLNKPEFIGMWMLDLSKVLMYEFHYAYIKNKYDNKSKLLLRDTNSLMHEIKTEDDTKF